MSTVEEWLKAQRKSYYDIIRKYVDFLTTNIFKSQRIYTRKHYYYYVSSKLGSGIKRFVFTLSRNGYNINVLNAYGNI
jgi:hypothetical protein